MQVCLVTERAISGQVHLSLVLNAFGPVIFRKILVSVKLFVRNSGAGNGCANFMDTWKKCVLSAGKTMSVKFPFFGVGVWGEGGECRFDFYGRADFSEISLMTLS